MLPAASDPTPSDDHSATALEVAVDDAIAACNGDLRATVRALLVGHGFQETELQELRGENARLSAAISFGYSRGRHRQPPAGS